MTGVEGKATGGGGNEGEVSVPEVKTEGELKDISKDKGKQKELLSNLKKGIEFSKTKLKKKIVGGDEKYAKELDKIIRESKLELQRIEKLP